MSSYKFPPEQNITHECLQQGNILLWHCQKLHKTILLQKEGYLMLKAGLIKEIRLGSWLFRSLSLWPEASSLTSVYLLALTQMSIIAFFPSFFGCFAFGYFPARHVFHFDFSLAEVHTLQQNYPCTYCCTHLRQPAALGKAATTTKF